MRYTPAIRNMALIFSLALVLALALAAPCIAMSADAPPEAAMPVYSLRVTVDTEGALQGHASIIMPEGADAAEGAGPRRVLMQGLTLSSAAFNGQRLAQAEGSDEILLPDGPGELDIQYSGLFTGGSQHQPDTMNTGDSRNSGIAQSTITAGGVSLTGGWYPQLIIPGGPPLYVYSLKAMLPAGFIAVSEAEGITYEDLDIGRVHVFDFTHPRDGMSLAAAPFTVTEDDVLGVKISTYLLPGSEDLAPKYIAKVKEYIGLYNGLIGPYPYKRFSVVENFLPTGYSMPTYTLLGSSVIRLPFIIDTSLGHEVLHQWFGNGVYVDYTYGNWSEALTAYLADYYYDELKGEGRAHRKKLLVDLRNHALENGKETALSEFMYRQDQASRSVGYGLGAMAVHMLRRDVGDGHFFGALNSFVGKYTFGRAGWPELIAEASAASGRDLRWFLNQWVLRKGVPEFSISSARASSARALVLGGRDIVRFTVTQPEPAYRVTLPVTVLCDGGEHTENVEMEGTEKKFELAVPCSPEYVVLDGGYDIARRLADYEVPPAVSGLIGDEKRVLAAPDAIVKDGGVVDDDGAGVYAGLAAMYKAQGFALKAATDVTDAEVRAGSVLALGFDSPLVQRYYGKGRDWPSISGMDATEGFAFIAMKHPLNPGRVFAIINATGRDESDAAAAKVFRYGRYSALGFSGGTNTRKAEGRAEDGIRAYVGRSVAAVRPSDAMPLRRMIDEVIGHRVIFLGESHTSYADHKAHLDIIRAMHGRGEDFAIGMEMFQTPFQNSLDGYVSGGLSEMGFLESSEYYTRWRFNYHLYREILDFARSSGIPVIALNQRAEVTKKVSAGGLGSLTGEERASLPEDMDFSDLGYRERLWDVYRQHEGAGSRDFTNFYQAQVLWDETMAHTAADYLRSNPESKLVVIAGLGHIAYGSGIPDRLYRLYPASYVTLIDSEAGYMDAKAADYILFAEPVEEPDTPVLGVKLAMTVKGAGLLIDAVTPGSPAARAGVRDGDLLLEAGGRALADMDDLKLALYGTPEDGTLTVKLRRKRFLLGAKELSVDVDFGAGKGEKR